MFDRLVVRNFLLYGLYQAMRLGFPLIATPFLTHVLKRDGFSDFAVINSCLWTSTVFMEFGFFLYGISKTAAAVTDAELREVVSSISMSKLSLAPVSIVIYLAMAATTGVLMRAPAATAFGLVGALGYGGSLAWFFQGRQKGLTAVLTEAVPQVIQFALLLSFVRSPSDLWLVFALQAIPPVSSITYSIVYLKRAGLLAVTSFDTIFATLKAAWPFFVERFCNATYTAVMPALILLLSTKSEVAYYSIGDRVGTLIISLCQPLNQAFLPRVAKAAQAPDGGWRLSWGLVAFEIGVIAVFAAMIYAVIGYVIGRFFTPDYAPATLVAQIFCVIACVLAVSNTLASFILIPRDRAGVLVWSSALALIVGLATQVAVIPIWGAPGAAFGRLISQTAVVLVLGLAAVRLYRQRKAGAPTKP
ncbi:MAG: oligosaccharide flippase family protein [Caulobacteraceae bacterium]